MAEERQHAVTGSHSCRTHIGMTPNLFLRLSGIGYVYLRLCHPGIPSTLYLRPEEFRPAQPC